MRRTFLYRVPLPWLMLLMPVLAGSASAQRPAVQPLQQADAGLSPAETRIVNGLETVTFPETVAVLIDTAICSGTIIDCDTVLTAAHCVCDTVGANCQPGGPDLADPSTVTVFAQHGGMFGVSAIHVPQNYDFGSEGDVAVLDLTPMSTLATPSEVASVVGTVYPVNGITPALVNTTGTPPYGTVGQIVGFGRTGGTNSDSGIKRYGLVQTSECTVVPDSEHVCWQFLSPVGPPGQDSNTCQGDSGGPLFTNDGQNIVVSGVTSGGQNVTCLTDDNSFDSDVYANRDFIQQAASRVALAEPGGGTCGDLPDVFSPSIPLVYFCNPVLSGTTPQVLCGPLEVPANTRALRVGLNGMFSIDADLYVAYNRQPSTADYDCRPFLAGSFEFCEFREGSTPAAPTAPTELRSPAAVPPPGVDPGQWWVLVDRFAGTEGQTQVTLTIFPELRIFSDGFETNDTSEWSATVP